MTEREDRAWWQGFWTAVGAVVLAVVVLLVLHVAGP